MQRPFLLYLLMTWTKQSDKAPNDFSRGARLENWLALRISWLTCPCFSYITSGSCRDTTSVEPRLLPSSFQRHPTTAQLQTVTSDNPPKTISQYGWKSKWLSNIMYRSPILKLTKIRLTFCYTLTNLFTPLCNVLFVINQIGITDSLQRSPRGAIFQNLSNFWILELSDGRVEWPIDRTAIPAMRSLLTLKRTPNAFEMKWLIHLKILP
jgi:hypothetical protein